MKKNSIFPEQVIVAVDIGTTKISVLVALTQGTSIEIIGIGNAPSCGLEKGIVVNIDRTVHSIKSAVREAELMAGCPIGKACIGISGSHIQSKASHGMIALKKDEIRASDIMQVLTAARAISITEGQQILHALPKHFIIDGHHKVANPLGMYGVRLEVQAHIITGSVASVHNLVKCCHMAGLTVTDIILEQLASANAVVTEDEKKLGIVMIDIGGGTSDIALFHNNSIGYTRVVPVAGNHFTHDLAVGLNTTIHEAERVKKEYGSVYTLSSQPPVLEVLCMNGIDKKMVHHEDIVSIIHPRAQELLTLIHNDVVRSKVHHLTTAGVVLTGGGSLLAGIQELAHAIFKVPVRLGVPHNTSDCGTLLRTPLYATGYGLLLHAIQKQDADIMRLSGPLIMRIMGRMKSWINEFL